MAVTPIVAIVGRPNVGKSSLFNRLIGARQAITHETPGTTRNANYGAVSWRGYHFTLVDTAGLSKADGEIELQAQDQIQQMASTASVMVVVVDAGTMITAEDQTAAKLALRSGKPVILVLGKADAARDTEINAWRRLGIPTIIPVSAIHGSGTGDLLDAITIQIEATPVPVETNPPLKLALIGRPNVGKSSLLNNLVGKQKAVVSSIPGTTRDIAHETIKYHEREIRLLDTAGLRRRGRIEPGIEKFSALRTMAAINEADICVLVMDASEGHVAGDLNLAGQIIEAGKGLILAMNKWDAVDKDEKTQDHLTAQIKQDFQFVWWAPLVYTSAISGLHTNQLMDLALKIEERRNTQVSTGPFNRLVEKLTAKQPPAGLKGKMPKINYGTQTGVNPPTFAFFCTYPDLIHFSYRRYLENNIRDEWDFTGTPITFEFKHKHGENLRRKERKRK
ncbi:MAG TPA: ribosome biogenesis GTPase Der [Candidatus Saccharimonadia bacterium]|jgi:GTP-binding protein